MNLYCIFNDFLHASNQSKPRKCASRVGEKQIFTENVKKLIIITGKGIHSDNEKNPYISKDLSILKYSVPEFIKKEDELIKIVKSIEEASEEDGGKGAFYVYLKKNNNSL